MCFIVYPQELQCMTSVHKVCNWLIKVRCGEFLQNISLWVFSYIYKSYILGMLLQALLSTQTNFVLQKFFVQFVRLVLSLFTVYHFPSKPGQCLLCHWVSGVTLCSYLICACHQAVIKIYICMLSSLFFPLIKTTSQLMTMKTSWLSDRLKLHENLMITCLFLNLNATVSTASATHIIPKMAYLCKQM